MKRLPFILIPIVILLMVASCNYIPFPCNLLPSRNSDFNIDPIERDDNRFEILRDTIISQKSFLNDNELTFVNPSLIEQPLVCTSRHTKNNNKPNGNILIKTTVTKEEANNQKLIITKKEIFTIEKVNNENSLVGLGTELRTVVKVRKQTVIITKVEEQS
jgi:hypothetical protein